MGYIRPVDLPVSSGYGMRDGGFHYGIDFSDGVAGHPIRSIADGQVVYNAFEGDGFGNTITVLHDDGVKSGYGHMIAPSPIPVGTRVVQGQEIGQVGTTGASTGPHLHLWMGSSPNPPGVIDPSPFVLGAPAPPTGGLSMTDIDTIGKWMQDDRDLYGKWMQEQSANVVKALDAKLDKIIELLEKK